MFVTPPGRVVCNTIFGHTIYFTITDENDLIQRRHLRGRFYERHELELIRKWCKPWSVFCDIGANIGNHTIYVAKYLNPSRVILFEPNPVAVEILTSNIALNGIAPRCDMTHLGKGLSNKNAGGLGVRTSDGNLGSTKMVEGEGDLQVVRGDSVLKGARVDFIKMDVEGMEMKALEGLSETIAAHRPTLFVEVSDKLQEVFLAWADTNGYDVVERYKRYRFNENFLLVARETPDPA